MFLGAGVEPKELNPDRALFPAKLNEFSPVELDLVARAVFLAAECGAKDLWSRVQGFDPICATPERLERAIQHYEALLSLNTSCELPKLLSPQAQTSSPRPKF